MLFWFHFTVEESMLLNRTLTYVNQHQMCLVNQFSRDLEASKKALLAARVQIQSQPAETSQAMKHLEQKLSEVEVKVKQVRIEDMGQGQRVQDNIGQGQLSQGSI